MPAHQQDGQPADGHSPARPDTTASIGNQTLPSRQKQQVRGHLASTAGGLKIFRPHGANLGIRGDSYLALGGWPELASGEDAELARRAAVAGHLRIARTASIPVVTSTRRAGRAPLGFSGYLRDLAPSRCAPHDDPWHQLPFLSAGHSCDPAKLTRDEPVPNQAFWVDAILGIGFWCMGLSSCC